MSDLTTLEQIERRIGQAPDNADFTLTASNREAVEDWLIAQGFDETRIRSARGGLISNAYSIPNYRRKLRHRSDYYPAAARTTQETKADDRLAENVGGNRPGPERTAASHTQTDRREPQMDAGVRDGARELPKIPAPTPGIAVSQVSDHAAVLASAIQALAGHGISEQRVIALIEKHVPAIVRQVLSEAMAAVAVNLDLE